MRNPGGHFPFSNKTRKNKFGKLLKDIEFASFELMGQFSKSFHEADMTFSQLMGQFSTIGQRFDARFFSVTGFVGK